MVVVYLMTTWYVWYKGGVRRSMVNVVETVKPTVMPKKVSIKEKPLSLQGE